MSLTFTERERIRFRFKSAVRKQRDSSLVLCGIGLLILVSLSDTTILYYYYELESLFSAKIAVRLINSMSLGFYDHGDLHLHIPFTSLKTRELGDRERLGGWKPSTKGSVYTEKSQATLK